MKKTETSTIQKTKQLKEAEVIQSAKQLLEQADALTYQALNSLFPLAQAAAATKSVNEIRRVAALMPGRCYLGSELRLLAKQLETTTVK